LSHWRKVSTAQRPRPTAAIWPTALKEIIDTNPASYALVA
jgi:hypothetical protein